MEKFKFMYFNIVILFTLQFVQADLDPAGNMLQDWESEQSPKPQRATDQRGCPVPSVSASLTVGPYGNILLQDTNLIEHLAHFNRERIPERPVHAHGAGAFGYFQVTHDITEFTKAEVLDKIGKKTPVVVRFSTTVGETGTSDLVLDGRGFAIKFKTKQGNWDLVGLNVQIFQIRDPILFPMSLHSRKRNPRTGLLDPNTRWDFDGQRPETAFQTMILMSGLGRPDGFRHMDGRGIHTFKLVNRQGKQVYCKFHWLSDQGIKNLTIEQAASIDDPDYAARDLYNSIENKRFPSWTFYIQVMTFEQAATYPWNPFDITKLWFLKDFPLIRVGKLVLDQNPSNIFTDVEESAFAVGNLVPGIEPSPDKMLQSRMFAYSDAQRYRLGPNSNLIAVNRPRSSVKVNTYLRDGYGCLNPSDNRDGSPNYAPNTFDRVFVDPNGNSTVFFLRGDVARTDTGGEDNFSQAKLYWRHEMDHFQRQSFVENIVDSLKDTFDRIQKKIVFNYDQIDLEIGQMLRVALAEVKRKRS